MAGEPNAAATKYAGTATQSASSVIQPGRLPPNSRVLACASKAACAIAAIAATGMGPAAEARLFSQRVAIVIAPRASASPSRNTATRSASRGPPGIIRMRAARAPDSDPLR